MKKIFILAVFIAVVGVLCAVFFTRADRQSGSDEKPWTVGENVSAESRTEETSRAPYTDAVEAFSDYINLRLREDYAILSTENGVRYASDALQKAILGVYIYDVDADDAQELTVVRNEADGVYLDVYEFKNAEVQRADSIKLVLDPMEKTDFSLALADFAHISARMTIFPDGAYRYFCLTVEQQNMPQALDEDAAEASAAPDAESTKAPAAQSRAGDYNAYTVVLQYSKEKLAANRYIFVYTSLKCVGIGRLAYHDAVMHGNCDPRFYRIHKNCCFPGIHGVCSADRHADDIALYCTRFGCIIGISADVYAAAVNCNYIAKPAIVFRVERLVDIISRYCLYGYSGYQSCLPGYKRIYLFLGYFMLEHCIFHTSWEDIYRLFVCRFVDVFK